MRNLAFGVILMLLLGQTAVADTPQAPPKENRVSSNNQEFIVISMPKSKSTVVIGKKNNHVWTMPGWFRWMFMSNDGQHLVTGWDGMNLIPLNYSKDMVLITFWAKGKKIREVRLKEIIPDQKILQRTASHYQWGSIIGIDEKNRLMVSRADKKVLLFDVSTGQEIK